jgi:phage tail sheath gpL-like
MSFNANSKATITASAVENTQFVAGAQVKPRKIVLIGSYDPSKTLVVDEVPKQILSASDAGDQFGFGFMLHRLAKATFAGAQGVEVWVVPQSEVAGNQAAGSFEFADGPATEAGEIALYVGGERIAVPVAKGDTGDDIAITAVAEMNKVLDLPTTQVVNGVTVDLVDVTAKTAGTYGNEISLKVNLGFQEELPAGIASVTIVAMTGGTGTPDIQDALDGMGVGDNQNENDFTALQHGYLQDTTTLDDIDTWNGSGNTAVGNWAYEVARPVRSLVGDVAEGSAGFTALKSLSGGRLLDRTTGVIAVPGSDVHPAELAAQAMGVMERLNANRAQDSYAEQLLSGIRPGAVDVRWTDDYDNRDDAVRSGISPTHVRAGSVYMQDVVSFYRPASVPIDSNGYRSQRNLSILQNILYNTILTFSQDKWKGITIVNDVTKVTSAIDRAKVRDISSVRQELVALLTSFERKAWIFTADFSIDSLAQAGAIEIRPGGTGFNSVVELLLSGEGGIINTLVRFDTALTAVLQAA